MNPQLDCLKLTALLQLASPAFPIGGFSYSQGLEAAIDHGLVFDEDSARSWVGDNLRLVFVACELPIWIMQYRNWQDHDLGAIARWNEWFLASRETREFRMETEQMGWSLSGLMQETGCGSASARRELAALKPVALPTAYAWAAVAREIPVDAGAAAYCFGWVENQVSAAVKGVPLGQVAAQRILNALRSPIAEAVGEAFERAQSQRLSTLAPKLAILSARHESQYSRLFRS